MEINKIRELALANGFSLKEQASGNMDLHSYVYEFANALLKEATPEGFVLVLKQPTNEIILKGCGEVADCTSTEEMERAYKTMIEAQEQSHDNSN